MRPSLPRRHARPLCHRFVLVCGGSQGIGLSTAAEVVRRGGSVAVVARDPQRLQESAASLREMCTTADQFVDSEACDTTDEDAFAVALGHLVTRRGVPDVLVCNVGAADPGYLHELGVADFRQTMDTNFFGQLVPTLALLPAMRARGRGQVVLVSSMLGYFSIMGYAAYSPSKFALVGLAEALRNEVAPDGVTVSVAYPPDTLTPGYDRENVTKPAECRDMSAATKALTADQVGAAIANGIERGDKHILPGDAAKVWRLKRHAPGLLDILLTRSYAAARARSTRVS